MLITAPTSGTCFSITAIGGEKDFQCYPDDTLLILEISPNQTEVHIVEDMDYMIRYQKGVFGVPTIIIDDNLFWGNDQMDHIELLLDGKDPLDRERLNDQETPRAIDRKAFKKNIKNDMLNSVLPLANFCYIRACKTETIEWE